jgi:hypothetical protein
MKKTFRSIGAVVAGFLATFILSVLTDYLLLVTGIVSQGSYTTWMYVLAIVYRTIFAAAGGYLTSYLAPDRKMLHVYILAGLGFVLGTLGTILNWDLAAGAEWYPIVMLILSVVGVYVGGKYNNK